MNRPSWILVLSPWARVRALEGGAGTPVLADLLDALAATGDAVELVVPRADTQRAVPEGFGLHRAPGRSRSSAAGQVLALAVQTPSFALAALRLARRRGRPRAVYGLSPALVPAAALVGALLGRPSVGVVFGTFLRPALGKPRRLAGRLAELVAFKTPVTRLEVLNDGTQGDEVAKRLGVPDTRVVFWMHGVDFDACDEARCAPDPRRELGLPGAGPLVVSSSRLAGWKRVDRVLAAFARAVADCPDAMLVVAGDGPERGALERLAERLDIAASVRFLGPVPLALNRRLIAHADVACCFYDYSNAGVSLLESLACGTAVVVGDAGATADFVVDGKTGVVVPTNDPVAAGRAIVLLLQDPAHRARLADAARQDARRRFPTRSARQSLEIDLLDEIAPRS